MSVGRIEKGFKVSGNSQGQGHWESTYCI